MRRYCGNYLGYKPPHITWNFRQKNRKQTKKGPFMYFQWYISKGSFEHFSK
uniref:Uncharacterized protein n=1 Tax=Arundo donax TaxID=35708 RepID=A0A0A9BWF3_ARUDO